jgi:hypothetical protein
LGHRPLRLPREEEASRSEPHRLRLRLHLRLLLGDFRSEARQLRLLHLRLLPEAFLS